MAPGGLRVPIELETNPRFHNHGEGPYLGLAALRIYVNAFQQDKDLVEAFSVNVKSS